MTHIFAENATFSNLARSAVADGFVREVAQTPSTHLIVTMGLVLKAMTFSILVAWTIAANSLVFIVLYKNPRLQTVPNLLVANLAFSDLCLGLVVLPLSSIYACTGEWLFPETLCQIFVSADILCSTASIWNLGVVGLDRYWAITSPVSYLNKRNKKTASIMILAVWLSSTLISLAPLLGWKQIAEHGNLVNVNGVWQCTFLDLPSYTIYSATGSFFIPTTVMFFVYYKIYQAFARHKARQIYRQKVIRKHIESTILHEISHVLPTSDEFAKGLDEEEDDDEDEEEDDEEDVERGIEDDDDGDDCTESPMDSGGSGEKNAEVFLPGAKNGIVHAKGSEKRVKKNGDNIGEERIGTKGNSNMNVLIREELQCTLASLKSKEIGSRQQQKSLEKTSSVGSGKTPVTVNNNQSSSCKAQKKLKRPSVIAVQSNRSGIVHSAVVSVNAGDSEFRSTSPSSALNTAIPDTRPSMDWSARNKERLVKSKSSIVEATANSRSPLKRLVTNERSLMISYEKVKRHKERKERVYRKSLQKKPRAISAAKEKRGVKVLGIILGCFTVCWTPFFVMYVAVQFCSWCTVNPHIEMFITWLGYSNSAMNPIIYTVFNKDYQVALRRLFYGRQCKYSMVTNRPPVPEK